MIRCIGFFDGMELTTPVCREHDWAIPSRLARVPFSFADDMHVGDRCGILFRQMVYPFAQASLAYEPIRLSFMESSTEMQNA